MKEIIDQLIKFRNDRDWQQFHTPKNLAESLSIEAGEVLRLFQWTEGCRNENELRKEVADVLIYALYLCDYLGVDPKVIIQNKIAINALNYPVEKARGNCKKHDEL